VPEPVGWERTQHEEVWGVVARGPARTNWNQFPQAFGIGGDPDDLMAKVEGKRIFDPEFKQKWTGWTFYPVRLDKGIRF
jgi:hypothetical protein